MGNIYILYITYIFVYTSNIRISFLPLFTIMDLIVLLNVPQVGQPFCLRQAEGVAETMYVFTPVCPFVRMSALVRLSVSEQLISGTVGPIDMQLCTHTPWRGPLSIPTCCHSDIDF